VSDQEVHSALGASGGSRWLTCAASVQASEGIEDESSEAAAEGTAAHALAQECLETGMPCELFIGSEFNGFVVDFEMADFVQVYVDFCESLDQTQVYVEKLVDFSHLVPTGFGTADYVSISQGIATIVDLKYGRMEVLADGPQLKLYALGVIQEFGFEAMIDTVEMVIVQPRLGQVDKYTMRVKDLLTWGKEVAAPGAQAALAANPEFTPTDVACRFCKASPTCVALAEKNLEMVQMSFADLSFKEPDPHHLDIHQIEALLPHLPLLKSWADKVEKHAQKLARDGQQISGYKLVKGRKNKKWADDRKAIEAMQKHTNEAVFSVKPISPTQALKLLGEGKQEVNDLIIKPEGQPTLVPASDRRAEINQLQGFHVIED